MLTAAGHLRKLKPEWGDAPSMAQLEAFRAELLGECDVLNRAHTDESRAAFDAKMPVVEELNDTLGRMRTLTALVAGDMRIVTHNQIPFGGGPLAPRQGSDNAGAHYSSDRVRLMAEALSAKFSGRAPSNDAREFLHMRAVDMAKDCLAARGVPTTFLSPQAVVTRALHTSSDFVELLTGAGNRTLRQGYDSYQGGIVRICKQSTAPDFRAKQRLMLGQAPTLLEVGEGAEVHRGTMAESKTSYSLATYARIFGITRQALVNDDLGAFVDLAGRLGRAAAEFVAGQLAAKITGNPVMSDGVVLFHATHANLGTAAVISITSLGEALKLMRLQKGLDGTTVIDVTPKYLVVPAALEVIARQHVAQINANATTAVNPFSAQLEVVVDPRLDATSATAWYLAAEPDAIDTIEFSYLEGAEGPQIESHAGFDVEGLELKVRLDFGSGVIDHRGLLRNNGA